MRTAWIPISRSCDQRCTFCAASDTLDGAPVPAATLRDLLDRAIADGVERIVFTGGEPTRSPDLLKAISYARNSGVRTSLSTHGRNLTDMGRVGRLVAAGLDELRVSVHGATAETHAALTGTDALALDQVLAALTCCAPHFALVVRTVLTARNAHEVPALVALASGHGASFELILPRPEGRARDLQPLPPDEALTTWRRAFDRCAALGVHFEHQGFDTLDTWALPAPLDAMDPLDPAGLALHELGVHDRPLRAGISTLTPALQAHLATRRHVSPDDLPDLLAAERLPVRDALEPRGPRTRRLPPQARLLVIVDEDTDPLAAVSTLPALVHVLRQRGADAHLASLVREQFDPTTLTPRTVSGARAAFARVLRPEPVDPRPAFPGDPDVDAAGWARATVRLGQRLTELADRPDLVLVTWGARAAARWRQLPALARATTHVLDASATDGLDLLGPHDVVHAPDPHTAHLRALAGTLGRTRWAPLPAWLPHLDTPAAVRVTSRVLLVPTGVSHPLWTAAAKRAGLSLAPLDPRAHPVELRDTLTTARGLWLPPLLAPKGFDARLPSLARAAGLPILGATLPAHVAHVRPTDALLAPVDSTAQAALLTRCADDAGWARLVDGAVTRRAVADVSHLADAILNGDRAPRAVPLDAAHGPWWSW